MQDFLFLNEMYTSFNISLINHNSYFLKGEYIQHFKRDDNWKYPDSFREHGYAIGIGKKIFLNRYILFDIGLGAQYYEAKWMDAQEQIIRKETIQFSFTTGFHIYFNLKN